MKKILLLFDIDGTLTESRKTIGNGMIQTLQSIKNLQSTDISISLGVVGGSDLTKQKEQLGEVWPLFDYQFAENGLIYYRDSKFVQKTSIVGHLGEENIKRMINTILKRLSGVDCPVKRGTFIEFRTGLLNVCPVGRSCSQEKREEFYEFDNKHEIREQLAKEFTEDFADLGIKVSIGGQISMDIFPIGWDKTFCLQFLEGEFDEIHFFGDKTHEGGNDYEIYVDSRTVGHHTDGPQTTIGIINEILNSNNVS